MKILLLGWSGFIGTRIRAALENAGHSIVLFPRQAPVSSGRRASTVTDASKRTQALIISAIEDSGADALINLAWSGLPDYSVPTTVRNARLSLAIQEAWAESSCPLYVGFGSCLEYGDSRGPLGELSPALNANFFGKTKTWLHDHVSELAADRGKRYLWVKPFWLYGPGQREESLLPAAFRSAREGHLLKLKTPDNCLDFLHVDDLCDAVVNLLQSDQVVGPFNIGSGEPTRVGDIAQIVFSSVSGVHPERTAAVGSPLAMATWSTNERISEISSWAPTRSWEQYILDQASQEGMK